MDEDSIDLEGNTMDSNELDERVDKPGNKTADDVTTPSIDEEESMEASTKVVKRRRLIIEEDSDDEPDPKRNDDGPDADENEETDLNDTSMKRNNRIIDEDSDENEVQNEVLNNSKKVIRNLKSICDEESSDDEKEEENDDQSRRSPMESSDEDSNANDGPSPQLPSRSPKVKLQRKAKAEAEHVISMIQKNAREQELVVPYHCPEQQNLKDFLERLQSKKSALVVEEKVEMKTHKFKLLKDIPREAIPAKETSDPVPIDDIVDQVNDIPKLQPFKETLTLKGNSNFMIDLETGQTFAKKTVADKLISDLMRNNRRGLQTNDPKFQPEPVPGAPLKQLKMNLECELERKRKETILKILEVEKVAKDEEEELLDDEEFELDSDDETKKKRSKKKEVVDEEEEIKKTVEFNDEEMEESGEGGENPEDLSNDEEEEDDNAVANNEEDDDDEEDAEEEEESESESEPEEETSEVKKPLRRIVAMEDSDEEQESPQLAADPSQVPEITSTAAPPLFDDIPTEPLFGFGFNATQNDNELFDLCSGKFTTQLPLTESSSQVVEASQVKDFEFPTTTSSLEEEAKQKEEATEKETEEKTNEIEDLDVAGPQKFNLSSSEDEQSLPVDYDEMATDQRRVKKKTKKKKRIFIEADDEDEESLPAKPEEKEFPSDEEEEGEKDNQLPPEAIEELEEYKSFLTGKPPSKGDKLNAADFLEKEAELSDSEWGSEDEDERGLDQLEDLEGLVKDDDEFDESVMRDELGRIHMRQMVNEDNRELKYLKDLILNEEETDGQGRQRTFRWQNVNSENDDFNATAAGNGVDGDLEGDQSSDDDENEANWRKVRLEREQALLTANKTDVTIQSRLEAVMSQTRDIRVVKPANSAETVLKENSSPSFLMQEQSKKYMNLRQSFLLRDEETLNRLATISAKADAASGAVSDGKNNFVFRRIEEKPNVDPDQPKKRKSNGQYPNGLQSINPAQKKRKV